MQAWVAEGHKGSCVPHAGRVPHRAAAFLSVFMALSGLCGHTGSSLVVASGAALWLQCTQASRRSGFSCRRAWALKLQVSSCVPWFSCPSARGIFPEQRANPCLLCWQADSQPLDHQGSPVYRLTFYPVAFLNLLVNSNDIFSRFLRIYYMQEDVIHK